MFELDGVTVSGEEILEETSESLTSCLLVDFKVVEVTTSSTVPLEQVGLLVLHGAFRSHTHLYLLLNY